MTSRLSAIASRRRRLTNVARHASASNVWVDLRVIAGNLRLTIGDDGDGFEVASMQQRAREGGSAGLLDLEERANLGHGDLTIASEPGHGTTSHAHRSVRGCGISRWG